MMNVLVKVPLLVASMYLTFLASAESGIILQYSEITWLCVHSTSINSVATLGLDVCNKNDANQIIDFNLTSFNSGDPFTVTLNGNCVTAQGIVDYVDGTEVFQQDCTGDDTQNWRRKPNSNGMASRFQFESVAFEGYCITFLPDDPTAVVLTLPVPTLHDCFGEYAGFQSLEMYVPNIDSSAATKLLY